MFQKFISLALGTVFGIVVVKSELASWERINSMFRFEDAYMYLVITTAVVIGAISVWMIKRFQIKSISNQPISIGSRQYQHGVIWGGLVFGLGWAITGACPGPIYAQIGAGEYVAIITLVGAVVGAYLYAMTQKWLPH